jgi:hypothetical protein
VGVRRGERLLLMHLTQISFKGFLVERPGGSLSVPGTGTFLGVLSSLYQLLKEPVFKPQTGRGESDRPKVPAIVNKCHQNRSFFVHP